MWCSPVQVDALSQHKQCLSKWLSWTMLGCHKMASDKMLCKNIIELVSLSSIFVKSFQL